MDFSDFRKRKNLIILGVLVLLLIAIPLGVTLLQRQTQINSRADNETFECSQSAADNGTMTQACSGEKDGVICHGVRYSEWAGKCLDEDGSQKNCEEGDETFLCKWSECKFEPGQFTCEDSETPPLPPPPVTNNSCDPECSVDSATPICSNGQCRPCAGGSECPNQKICDYRDGSPDKGKCVSSIGTPGAATGTNSSGTPINGKILTCKGERDLDGFLAEIGKVRGTPYGKDTASIKQALADYNALACAKTDTARTGGGGTGSSGGSSGGNSGGNSGGSSGGNNSGGAQPAAVKPGVPTDLYGHCSGTQASVFWNTAENAQTYNLKIGDSASNWRGTSVYFGSSSGGSYQVSVQAVNGNQTSDYSSAVTVNCK